MATIQNPTPITTNTFNGMWISQLQIFLPQGNVQASFLPYDGTHLLATGGKNFRQIAPAGSFNSLIADVKTLANKTVEPTLVQVFAQDPSKPVSAQFIFSDRTNYRINDVYALAATDSVFAGLLNNTMGLVATLAGYTITLH
jgi:hypothetical protein